MNPSFVEKELTTALVREGLLYKRSKFLKEWEQRWVILTKNYIFIYQDKSRKVLTDSIDLAEIKNYKSYVRKEDDATTSSLKIRSDSNMYYLTFSSVEEKWSWIVTLERLMDFKVHGKSNYNGQEFIKTKGFASQQQVQEGKSNLIVKPVHQENKEPLMNENQYKKEIERLNKEILNQQKYFQNIFTQKFKELNVIEEAIIEKEKKYKETIKQLQEKLQKANENKQVERNLAKTLIAAQEPEKKSDLPKVQHVIKSHYLSDLVSSLVGYTISSQNITVNSTVVHEDFPILKENITKVAQQSDKTNPLINQIESILGYSITPSQYPNIHTSQFQTKQEIIVIEEPSNKLPSEDNQNEKRLKQINEELQRRISEKQLTILLINKQYDQQFSKIKQAEQNLANKLVEATETIKRLESELQIQAQKNTEKQDLPVQSAANQQVQKSQQTQKIPVEPAIIIALELEKKKLEEQNDAHLKQIETLSNEIVLLKESLLAVNEGKQTHEEQINALKQASETKFSLNNSSKAQIILGLELLNKKFQEDSSQLKQQIEVLKRQVEDLKTALQAANNSLKTLSEAKIPEVSAVPQVQQQQPFKVEQINQEKIPEQIILPVTGHVVKSSYQHDLIESMLGFSVPHSQKPFINAPIIHDKQSQKVQINQKKVTQHQRHTKVDHLQTVLGVSVPPHKYEQLHTSGYINIPKAEVRIIEKIIEIVDEKLTNQLKNEISQLKAKLDEVNRQLQREKTLIAQKIEVIVDEIKVEEKLLEINYHYQHELVESLLGQSLSPAQRQKLLVKAKIYKEEAVVEKKNGHKVDHSYGKIDAIETVLGHSIAPTNYSSIYYQTEQQLAEKSLKDSSKILSRQLDLSLGREEALQQQINYLRTQLNDKSQHLAISLQKQRELQKKLKEHQQLFEQFETKYSTIQEKPVQTSQASESKTKKVEMKQLDAQPPAWKRTQSMTDSPLPKPSWVKQASTSSKNDKVPAWVKVRPEQEEEKKSQPQVVTSSIASIGRVMEMRKLFESKIQQKQQPKSIIKTSKISQPRKVSQSQKE